MKCVPIMMTVCVAVTAALGSSAVAQNGLTDERVGQAMDRAIRFIYNQQSSWGHWDHAKARHGVKDKDNHHYKQFTGYTALATYALLSAGEQWQGNDKLISALKFLAQNGANGSYATGLRNHVWNKLPERSLEIDFHAAFKRDAEMLVRGMQDRGTFTYLLSAYEKWDHSCTQYGALGIWEAAKRDLQIPDSTWEQLRDHFLSKQHPTNGGWAYKNPQDDRKKPDIQMTAAGLACMYITLEYLHAADFRQPGGTDSHRVYQSILRGLEFMNNNYRPEADGYNMVGVERVALASGWKYFNGKDWYRSGAQRLINSQEGSGKIGDGDHNGGSSITNTSFGLVFLSRGRVPVFANKLAFDEFTWNNRPFDLAHVTRWASDQFEQDMNWQVIGVGQSRPADWLDAPMLYLASHQSLDEVAESDLNKVKRYIDLGGMLVVNGDASSTFTRSVRQKFEQMYPYNFQPVPADDPVHNIVFPIQSSRVQSLHNGIRHLVVILPGDVGWTWQSKSMRQIEDWQVMANLFQYAIERGKPRNRLDVHFVEKTGHPGTRVEVARARYDGNWDPEPLAWERLDTFASNANKAGFTTQTVELADLADGNDVAMTHVVGTDAVTFTPAQIEAIRRYVNGGGVIVFEAAGGSAAFSASVKQMLIEAFPDNRVQRLPATSPVLSGVGIAGFDCTEVDYRMFYKQNLGPMTRPSLQAMLFDGQPRVILSAEDMTAGMVGQPVWGVFGYDSESASQLMTNIAMWANSMR